MAEKIQCHKSERLWKMIAYFDITQLQPGPGPEPEPETGPEPGKIVQQVYILLLDETPDSREIL